MEDDPVEALTSGAQRRDLYVECLRGISKLGQTDYTLVRYRNVLEVIVAASAVAVSCKWLFDLNKLEAVVIFACVAIIISLSFIPMAIIHSADILQRRLHAISLCTANFDDNRN
jgi:hypothetical protein